MLFQHFFWFYSHPAVYIMILPGMGDHQRAHPDVLAQARSSATRAIAFSSASRIALLGFLVWGHHMFVAGQSRAGDRDLLVPDLPRRDPVGRQGVQLAGHAVQGLITLDAPMLYALAFLFLFTIGGLTGLFLGTLAVDIHLHDTYFVVAHFHYVMMGGTVIGVHRRPALLVAEDDGPDVQREAGRASPRRCVFIGFNVTFFTQFILGSRGMPRRYYNYLDQFQPLHAFSTVGSWIIGSGLFLTAAYPAGFAAQAAGAPDNPWGGTTLEWKTPRRPSPRTSKTAGARARAVRLPAKPVTQLNR